jgi:hypothetical protein
MTVRGINDKIASQNKTKYQIMITLINLITFSRIIFATLIFSFIDVAR